LFKAWTSLHATLIQILPAHIRYELRIGFLILQLTQIMKWINKLISFLNKTDENWIVVIFVGQTVPVVWTVGGCDCCVDVIPDCPQKSWVSL